MQACHDGGCMHPGYDIVEAENDFIIVNGCPVRRMTYANPGRFRQLSAKVNLKIEEFIPYDHRQWTYRNHS